MTDLILFLIDLAWLALAIVQQISRESSIWTEDGKATVLVYFINAS